MDSNRTTKTDTATTLKQRAVIQKRAIHGAANPHKETRGDRMIRFANTLKIPDGPDAGCVTRLRDWECNIYKGLYDAETTRRNRTVRAVREAVWTMARKNSKTTNASRLLLGHLVGPETQRNGQLCSAAFDREQAGIVYNTAANMIAMDEELPSLVRMSDAKKEIRCPLFGTRFKSLSAEARSKHGMNPVFVIMDELGQFGTDRVLYDALRTSMGAQIEALMLTISTQADSDQAIMSQLVDYGRMNIDPNNPIKDPSFRLFEFAVPEVADIWDESNWILANPGLGDFRDVEEMRTFANRARMLPSLENTFRNLYLNQRVTGSAPFVPPQIWKANGGAVDMKALEGRVCYIALDLSSKRDLTACVLLFPDDDGNFDVVCKFWTPRGTLQERSVRERVPYEDWGQMGFLDIQPGGTVDYAKVAEFIAECAEKYEVAALGYDRWRIDIFKKYLDSAGIDVERFPLEPIGQGFKDMSPAIETLEDLLYDAKLRHGNHPVLTWNAASVRVTKDPAGNRKFDKASSSGRIDGLVCLAMAAKLVAGKGDGTVGKVRAGGMIVL